MARTPSPRHWAISLCKRDLDAYPTAANPTTCPPAAPTTLAGLLAIAAVMVVENADDQVCVTTVGELTA